MKYIPIECALHDQYLAYATMRTPVAVEYRGPEGQVFSVCGVIVDVYTSADGAEWMLIAGEKIRLDRILHVAPVIGTGQVAD